MKKIYVGMIATLLTLCGVNMMASLLSFGGTSQTNDTVSIPTSISVQSGNSVVVPISLENSNTNYTAFQMDVVLPKGVTPVLNASGKVTIKKTERLTDTHTISCNFDTDSNIIKVLCSSLDNDVISGTSGELFFINVQVDKSVYSGDYELKLTNVLFSTSTSAPEGAKSYSLSDATAIISVAGSEPVVTTSWSIIFNENDVCESGTVPESFGDGNFILGVSDANYKMSIDASSSRFGTIDDYTLFSYRLKTAGKSSKSQYLTLSIPQSGLLRIFARTANISTTDRTVVLTQDEKEIYNNVVSEDDAVEKTEINGAGEEVTFKIYPVIEVPVQAGIVEIGFPVGSINFYGFQLVVKGATETDEEVSVPSQISVDAGNVVSLPVSLENSNPNYVGFQMDINLPWGISPAMNPSGKIKTTKTDRLGETHTLSCNFDEKNNTIKIVCTSMDAEIITGTSGELFSIDLQTDASMQSGDYQIALTNVLFTTSSSAPEGAKSYEMPNVSAIISVEAQDGYLENIYSIDYARYNSFPFYVMGYVPEWYDGVMTDFGANYKYVKVSEDAEETSDVIVTAYGVDYYKISLSEPQWHQYFIADGISTEIGGTYIVKAMVKASEPCSINVNMGWGWSEGQSLGASVSIPDEWTEVEWEYTSIGGTSCNLVAQPGTFTGTIEWQWLTVSHFQKRPIEINPNPTVIVVHGQERDDLADTEDGEIREEEGGTGQVWDNQFFIKANRPLKAGERTMIEFDFMSTFEAQTTTECHIEPTSYLLWGAIDEIWFEPWEQHFSTEFIIPEDADGMKTIAFDMARIKEACDYTIKNVVWKLTDDTESLINQEGVDNFWLKEGVGDNVHVYDPNRPAVSLVQETFNFNAYSGIYFDGTQTIDGTYGKVTFAQGQGSRQPYGNYSYIYFYPGNTMTLSSDLDILRIEFSTYYWIGEYPVNTGKLTDNIWRGNTSDFTIMSPNNASTDRFYSITVTYENATPEALMNRLAIQLEATATAISSLIYAVPGKAELEALATEAASATVETGTAQLKAYIKQLKSQTEAVVALDQMYNNIAAAITQVEGVIQANQYANPTALEEANALIAQVNAGLATGAFTAADIQKIIDTFGRYAELLNQIYLIINVEEAGTLGDLILEKVENFNEVKGLSVSGKLNSADLQTLKGNLTSLTALDLYGTNLTTIANEQFRGQTALQGVILPSQLQSIGEYAFYGCTSLVDVVFPTKLQTIGSYAFYNCNNIVKVVLPESLKTIGEYAFQNCRRLENINFPEGLTSIDYHAFYCNSYDYYYDENGNYHEIRGSIKEISLPSTLKTLGSGAFGYQTCLEKVTFADGLTAINNSTFYYCTALTQLELPKTLESIGSEAFYYCTALKNVELPEGLTKIESNAFRYCTSLEEVVLPSTLQYVYHPFYNCNALTKMTAKAIVPAVTNDNSIMGGNESQCTLTVPNLSIKVYKQTSYWSQFNIVGADILPDNILIVNDYRLNWPDSVSQNYKPNVMIGKVENNNYYYSYQRYTYGSLTVQGNSTLSMQNFSMLYDFYWQRQYSSNPQSFTSLVNKGVMRADNVQLNMNLPYNRWCFITLPFDVKVSDIQIADSEVPFVVRKYDGQKRAEGLNNETWVNMTADSTLHAGKGYIWQTPSDNMLFTMTAQQTVNKNNIFANDNVDVELAYYESEFEHNRSWNLIGNPYPAYFDIRAMKTSAPITVWNMNNSNYEAYSPKDDSYILTPGQAFFVQRPVNESSITFLSEGRQINRVVNTDADYSGVNRVAANEERSVFNLTLTGTDQSDRTRFVINSKAKMDYESGRDASKFMSMEQGSSQLYTVLNNVQYAINERPLGDGMIELGLNIGSEGTYTIALDTQVENEVYLIDQETGEEIRIDGTEGYTFYAKKGVLEGRFIIRLGSGDVTGIKAIDKSQLTNDSYYNLGGQRVLNPAKGLYINNGKKVVVK